MTNSFKPDSPIGKRGTILVVDDNAALLRTVVAIIKRANFSVMSAIGGADAIRLSRETEGKIDLLLSDVEMPGISGPALGEMLRATRPDLRVMLMSGGAHGNLQVLNYGWAYIEKPFLAVKLIEMVTDVLRAPDHSQAGWSQIL